MFLYKCKVKKVSYKLGRSKENVSIDFRIPKIATYSSTERFTVSFDGADKKVIRFAAILCKCS